MWKGFIIFVSETFSVGLSGYDCVCLKPVALGHWISRSFTLKEAEGGFGNFYF